MDDEVEVIECKKEVVDREQKPDKRKENTFYRISPHAFEPVMVLEEKYKGLEKEMAAAADIYFEMRLRLDAARGIMKDNGIEDPDGKIDRRVEDLKKGAISPPPGRA
jgi:hypothetical protein